MEESLWISDTKKTNYQTLEKDEKADVCVIGGGIVGAITANSTAKLISQHGLFYKYYKISDNGFIEKKLNQMTDT